MVTPDQEDGGCGGDSPPQGMASPGAEPCEQATDDETAKEFGVDEPVGSQAIDASPVDDLCQPFLVVPGISLRGVGKHVDVGNRLGLRDVAPRGQRPPQVAAETRLRCRVQAREKQPGDEDAERQFMHDVLSVGFLVFRITRVLRWGLDPLLGSPRNYTPWFRINSKGCQTGPFGFRLRARPRRSLRTRSRIARPSLALRRWPGPVW